MDINVNDTRYLGTVLSFLILVTFSLNASQPDKPQTTTKISELKNYAPSTIEGKVVKILDEDEFRLQDESGKIKVYTGWRNTNLVTLNEKVKVTGKLDPGIVKEFYATEIIRENGEKVVLKKD